MTSFMKIFIFLLLFINELSVGHKKNFSESFFFLKKDIVNKIVTCQMSCALSVVRLFSISLSDAYNAPYY